jgi:hypothetical protein
VEVLGLPQRADAIYSKVCGKSGSLNWVAVLQDSADTLNSMGGPSAGASAAGKGASVAQKESSGAQLFRSAIHKGTLAKGYSILANLEMASLHLHFLIMNVSAFGLLRQSQIM